MRKRKCGLPLLVTALLLQSHVVRTDPKNPAPEELLFEWIQNLGGIVNMYSDKACDTCLRGAFATKDIAPAEVILRIPGQALIIFPYFDHPAFAAEYARVFLTQMHTNASFNETYANYLATLPPPEHISMPELWDPHHVPMLKTPTLEKIMDYHRQSTEGIFDGTYSEYQYSPLSSILEPNIDLSMFRYFTAVISTRYFGMRLTDDDDANITFVVAPVMDMVNHADAVENDDMNAYQTVVDGDFYLRAWRPIQKGEEIRFNYQPKVVHRNDMSLLIYGFIQKRRRPLLLSIDLPTFDMENYYAPTPETDEEFYGPKGAYNTPEEVERLKALLDDGRTEEEEVELLNSDDVTDPVERLIVEYRIERKKAIRHAIRAIEKELRKLKKKKEDKRDKSLARSEL